MKTQIVYVLVASGNNLYLEELWVSLYSLRIFHPEATVRVLVDDTTDRYLRRFPELCNMITEIVVVPVPEGYNAKQRSRIIKTSVRNVIDGAFLFIDTDTVICRSLQEIDKLACDIAAVPDGHLPLIDCMYPPTKGVEDMYGISLSEVKFWYNSGVMFVADNERTREFYKRWCENWKFSCFKKGNSQDQPALLATDNQCGFMIEEMPGTYNAQVAMSLKYFADAAILHWWHMDFIEDQSYSPYFSLQIYREVKAEGRITPHIEELIRNCKQSFVSPTMPVGREHIYFLFSPAGKIFNRIYRDGGIASFLMNKLAWWLDKIHNMTSK